jgi:hypothetical protein
VTADGAGRLLQAELAGLSYSGEVTVHRVVGVAHRLTRWTVNHADDGREFLVPADTVEVEGVRVVGRYLDDTSPSVTMPVHDLAECLFKFVRLADRPTRSIVSFANRYGALEVCESHLRARSHDPDCDRVPDMREAVDLWRRYSKYLGAFLGIAADLAYGDKGARPEDWAAARFPGLAARTAAEQRWRLGQLVAALAQESGSEPHFVVAPTATSPPFRASLRADQLSTILALGLVATLTTTTHLYRCDICQGPFTTAKRRRRTQRIYCDKSACKADGERLRARGRQRRHRGSSLAESGD